MKKNRTKWRNTPKVKARKRISLRILEISLVGAVMLPLVAYGSTQPGGAETASIEVENGDSGLGDIVRFAPTIIEKARTIYGQISSGDYDSAVVGILGALGIINPASESGQASNSEDSENPYANPETPEEVWELEQYTDYLRSKMPQRLSQIVFGRTGQEKMAAESEQIQAIEQASYEATESANSAYSKTEEIAKENVDYADSVVDSASEAQASKASQDVLKAIAAQNKDISHIMAGNSEQLSYLGEIATYQSSQLSGLSSQLTALNGKGETLQVLMASQNYLLSQVDDALGQQKDYQQYKDSLERGIEQNMSRAMFIPGLFKDDVD
ncbi:MAG: hypothetical protein QNJ60_00395 [Xenococcaceae cyanobacterium MO_188.B19]|nr:hypothetical protein [Xenococcaceae cyanobacterium MO_188.B19]